MANPKEEIESDSSNQNKGESTPYEDPAIAEQE